MKRQLDDGSWPFRVVPETGMIRQKFGGAPVFFVEFFDDILRYENKRAYRRARERAVELMLSRHIEKNLWGTYHEDVKPKSDAYLSAEPISFTADYLFRRAATHPEYVEMGKRILRPMEERLVHTAGHVAAPAPTVSEQAAFDHIMPGHTARYCLVLANLYRLTGDEQTHNTALSGLHAVTYMQSNAGLFRTFFHTLNENQRGKVRPDWYSQHLYAVCHLLEAMAALPSLVPDGEDHILSSDVAVREVRFEPNLVRFETIAPARTILKLSFAPMKVYIGGKELQPAKRAGARCWSFDPATSLLTIDHPGGRIEVRAFAR